MTGQELLAEAIAAAPHTSRGLTELHSRLTVAEGDLQAARQALKDVQSQEQEFADQRRAVENSLAEISRDLRALRPTNAVAYLDSLAGRPTQLADLSQKRRAFFDCKGIASETLEYLNAKGFGITVRRIEAEIAVTEKSRSWARAAAHADLAELYQTMLPVLKSDPTVSFEVGGGSRAAGYTGSINEFDLRLVDLREQLKQAKAVAERSGYENKNDREIA